MVKAKKVRSSGGMQVTPETWCSDGYGSAGEHEMRIDLRSREGRQEDDRV